MKVIEGVIRIGEHDRNSWTWEEVAIATKENWSVLRGVLEKSRRKMSVTHRDGNWIHNEYTKIIDSAGISDMIHDFKKEYGIDRFMVDDDKWWEKREDARRSMLKKIKDTETSERQFASACAAGFC